jgi:hypothetical protein
LLQGAVQPWLYINHNGSLVSTRSEGGYSPTLNVKLGALISQAVHRTLRICTFVPFTLTNWGWDQRLPPGSKVTSSSGGAIEMWWAFIGYTRGGNLWGYAPDTCCTLSQTAVVICEDVRLENICFWAERARVCRYSCSSNLDQFNFYSG